MVADGDQSQPRRRGYSRRSFLKGAAGDGRAIARPHVRSRISLSAAPNGSPRRTPSRAPRRRSGTLPVAGDRGLHDRDQRLPGETVASRSGPTRRNYRIRIYRLGWYGGWALVGSPTSPPRCRCPRRSPHPIDGHGHGPDGLRQLGDVGILDGPRRRRLGRLPGAVRAPRRGGQRNQILFVVRREPTVRRPPADVRHHVAGLQPLGRRQPLLRRPRATAVAYKVSATTARSRTARTRAPSSTPSTRSSAGWSATATTSPYCGDIDTDRDPAELLSHKVFISSGHDEYWSGAQRTNVEAARDAGVHLIFLSGNEVFWKVRWEPSHRRLGHAAPHHGLLQGDAGRRQDRSAARRGPARGAIRASARPATAAGPRTRSPARCSAAIIPGPEADYPIKVPPSLQPLPLLAQHVGRSAARRADGHPRPGHPGLRVRHRRATTAFRPAGLIRLSETTETVTEVLQRPRQDLRTGPLTHNLTMYRAASGALVWGAGTIQWAWGLDEYHDTHRPRTSRRTATCSRRP